MMMNPANRIRKWLWPLRFTPLHPQWLIFRDQSNTRHAVYSQARGWVLDIGCGDRWAASVLRDDCTYVGLDFPVTVSKGYPGHPDVFGDAAKHPFGPCSFETVLMMDVLEHLPRPDQAIQEAYRVLKPGGCLILQVPFLYPLHDEPHDFQRWTEHGLRTLLKAHQFEVRAFEHHGKALETAAALFAIALAKSALDSVRKLRLTLVLTPLIFLAIPLINTTGWWLAKLFPANSLMPTGYRLVAAKMQ